VSLTQTPSGKWRARWRTSDGVHRSKTFTLKRDAERHLRDAAIASENQTDHRASRAETIRTVSHSWWPSVERSVKPRTAERYAEHLETIWHDPIAKLPLAQVDYAEAQAFVDRLATRYAPATVSAIYSVLNLILTDGAKRGKVNAVPKPVMPRARRTQLVIPTRDEVEALAAAVDARICAAVILAGYCGLRLGELLALTRADVHIEAPAGGKREGNPPAGAPEARGTTLSGHGSFVFVHASRNQSTGAIEGTKTDAARRVYLPRRARHVLGEHLDEYPGLDGLFPVTASVFDKSWRLARTMTGLEGVRFHDLRHAAASNMIAAGWNVKLVSQFVGHANATQTLGTYTHLWPDSFAPAIRQLDEYLDHG
jgi:integrase